MAYHREAIEIKSINEAPACRARSIHHVHCPLNPSHRLPAHKFWITVPHWSVRGLQTGSNAGLGLVVYAGQSVFGGLINPLCTVFLRAHACNA